MATPTTLATPSQERVFLPIVQFPGITILDAKPRGRRVVIEFEYVDTRPPGHYPRDDFWGLVSVGPCGGLHGDIRAWDIVGLGPVWHLRNLAHLKRTLARQIERRV